MWTAFLMVYRGRPGQLAFLLTPQACLTFSISSRDSFLAGDQSVSEMSVKTSEPSEPPRPPSSPSLSVSSSSPAPRSPTLSSPTLSPGLAAGHTTRQATSGSPLSTLSRVFPGHRPGFLQLVLRSCEGDLIRAIEQLAASTAQPARSAFRALSPPVAHQGTAFYRPAPGPFFRPQGPPFPVAFATPTYPFLLPCPPGCTQCSSAPTILAGLAPSPLRSGQPDPWSFVEDTSTERLKNN